VSTNQDMTQRLRHNAEQARAILQSVAADGSWGVHNFKYTEAMLLRADELVREAK
jgi:hypothetical protein